MLHASATKHSAATRPIAYLQRRGTLLHIRIAVPADLRLTFSRREIAKAVRTDQVPPGLSVGAPTSGKPSVIVGIGVIFPNGDDTSDQFDALQEGVSFTET